MKTRTDRQQALDFWAERIAAQRASGLKIQDWCAEQGMSHWKFQYWRRVLGREGRIETLMPKNPSSSPAPNFQRVVIDPAPSHVPPIEIILPEGAVVRVQAGVDRQMLRLVLEEAKRC